MSEKDEERQNLLDEIEENIENLREACNMYIDSAEDLANSITDDTTIEELEDILHTIEEAYLNQPQEI
ncbi:MAG: hypothetical protein QXP59_03855 [Saccharolobus sp.]